MAHLGYKNKAFMNYQREQERIKIWKIKQKAKKKQRKRTVKRIKNLIGAVLYSLSIIVVAFLLYFLVTMPHVKADSPRVKGEFILFVTMPNGPAEETLFGGSFPNGEACIAYAKQNYSVEGKGWIAYKCIHEDVHEYLENKKGKGLDI